MAAQTLTKHATPILLTEADSLSFYDRLERTRVGLDEKQRTQNDSSFDWLVGAWTIEAKGFARYGYKKKTAFEWTEKPFEFISDDKHSIFIKYKDSTEFVTTEGRKKLPKPPQVILQHDDYGNVWVLQPGCNDRYDWGSLVAEGWMGSKIVFFGTISLSGIKCNERQTWTKISNDQIHIVYEQKLNTGDWFKTEENTYKRVQ